MRVLIVEDDVRMATAIRRGLQAEGVVADVATRGEDALWMAGATESDAVVDEARRLLKVTDAATQTT